MKNNINEMINNLLAQMEQIHKSISNAEMAKAVDTKRYIRSLTVLLGHDVDDIIPVDALIEEARSEITDAGIVSLYLEKIQDAESNDNSKLTKVLEQCEFMLKNYEQLGDCFEIIQKPLEVNMDQLFNQEGCTSAECNASETTDEELEVEPVELTADIEDVPVGELPMGYVKFDASKLGLKNEYAVNMRDTRLYQINRPRFIPSITNEFPFTFELEGRKITYVSILKLVYPGLNEESEHEQEESKIEELKETCINTTGHLIDADPNQYVWIDWIAYMPGRKYKLYGDGVVINTVSGKPVAKRKTNPKAKHLSVRLSYTTNNAGDKGAGITPPAKWFTVRELMMHAGWNYTEPVA